METPYQKMSLKQFQRRFRSEKSCREYMFALRWPNGFVCPSCGSKEYYRLPKRHLLQCKACARQTSVTAGAVMHKTRTPLRTWFWAIYLVAHDKRGLSALQLSKKLDVSYYVAWTMLHKIRRAMGESDSALPFSKVVRVSKAFVGGGAGGDKKGRGKERTSITVHVSIDSAGASSTRMRVEDPTPAQPESHAVVKTGVEDAEADKHPTGGRSPGRKEPGEGGNAAATIGRDSETPNWTQIVASNARCFLLGTFHGIGRKHLQAYLDEFCYRFNRRRSESHIFDSLLIACANSKGVIYSELTR